MTNDFTIKTESFEGPLDLLLNLIEKRKLLINDVSLAKITDDYINYVQMMEKVSLEKNSNFILVASTLLLIKSKSLLPTLELTEEESQSIEDLERRLKIYKELKKVEPKINEMFLKQPLFPKRKVIKTEIVFSPSKQVQIFTLKETILSVIKTFPKIEKTKRVMIYKVISLENMITTLTSRVQENINMSFKEFSGKFGKEEKVNVVVGFLAMLELVKQGIIEATQNSHDSDIHMQSKEFSTPNYS